MKRFFNFFLSSKATIILLIILAIAMAIATFIEDRYDTVTARILIYNTRWIEILFILLAINLIGHIKTYNLLSIKKIGGLIFHLAFIVMIIGAGITRYFGFEGNIHIRKGESSNIIYSSEPYLLVSYSDKKDTYNYEIPVLIGHIDTSALNVNVQSEDKGNIEIKYKNFVYNAVEIIEENVAGGKDMIELSLESEGVLQKIFIKNGEVKNIGKISIALNCDDNKDALKV